MSFYNSTVGPPPRRSLSRSQHVESNGLKHGTWRRCRHVYAIGFGIKAQLEFLGYLQDDDEMWLKQYWLVVSTPLKNIQSIGMTIPNVWKTRSKSPTRIINHPQNQHFLGDVNHQEMGWLMALFEPHYIMRGYYGGISGFPGATSSVPQAENKTYYIIWVTQCFADWWQTMNIFDYPSTSSQPIHLPTNTQGMKLVFSGAPFPESTPRKVYQLMSPKSWLIS